MTFERLHALLQTWLQRLLIILMATMAIDVLWQIATRFILGDPSVWTEELARFILIWLGALGAAYGVGEGFHLEMDYFLQKVGPKRRRQMDRIIFICILLIACTVFIYGGFRLLYIAYDLNQSSPALGIPMSSVYAVLPLSGFLMVVSCLHYMRYPRPHQTSSQSID